MRVHAWIANVGMQSMNVYECIYVSMQSVREYACVHCMRIRALTKGVCLNALYAYA